MPASHEDETATQPRPGGGENFSCLFPRQEWTDSRTLQEVHEGEAPPLYFGYAHYPLNSPQLSPWVYSNIPPFVPTPMSTAMAPSAVAVAGENKKSNKGKMKKKKNSTDVNNLPQSPGRYSLKEMTVLVDQVLKIEPEYIKNGWKLVAHAVDKEMGTNNPRSPTALQKKYEEIAQNNSDHPDLGPLVKKIRDREAADIEKKNILTSVHGFPGNILNLVSKGSDDEEKNKDENKNESKEETMLRRVKNTQRLKAIEENKKEREKNKASLSVLVAQSAAALAMASNSSGQGIKETIAELKINQKHLKRKVDQIENKVADLNTNVTDLNTTVQGMKHEFSKGFTRIEELITKKHQE
jgi:hypothetical protein